MRGRKAAKGEKAIQDAPCLRPRVCNLGKSNENICRSAYTQYTNDLEHQHRCCPGTGHQNHKGGPWLVNTSTGAVKKELKTQLGAGRASPPRTHCFIRDKAGVGPASLEANPPRLSYGSPVVVPLVVRSNGRTDGRSGPRGGDKAEETWPRRYKGGACGWLPRSWAWP